MSHTDRFWLKKSLKNPFFGKIPKNWKNPPKKNFFFVPNQEGFSRIFNTLNTVVKEFFTSETIPDVLHLANLIYRLNNVHVFCFE
jgi:hypothetical protein